MKIVRYFQMIYGIIRLPNTTGVDRIGVSHDKHELNSTVNHLNINLCKIIKYHCVQILKKVPTLYTIKYIQNSSQDVMIIHLSRACGSQNFEKLSKIVKRVHDVSVPTIKLAKYRGSYSKLYLYFITRSFLEILNSACPR